jgi:hypothetical protein
VLAFGAVMSPKQPHFSVLGPAFCCAAPIPLVAICLGCIVTPERYYYQLLGGLGLVIVYGFTGFLGAALSFVSALAVLFPERLGSLTSRGRLAVVLSISVFCCAAAVFAGLVSYWHEGPVHAY